MLELICHQTYDTWQGLPVDRSPYRNSTGEARGATYRPDGATPGSGALDFGTHPAHGVHIERTAAWRDLGALQVEMTVFLTGGPDLLGDKRVLIDGDDSFTFSASQFLGLSASGGTAFVHQLRLELVDQNGGRVVLVGDHAPFNTWGTVGFRYDGVLTAQLTVNGNVVAQKELSVPLRPVGSKGVSIGAPLTGTVRNHPLVLDEVKVWRRDPSYVHRIFLARPLSPAAADCLARAFAALRAAWAADPQLAAEQERRLRQLVDFLRRRIAASGAVDEWNALHRRYVELWTAGAVDSDEMGALVDEVTLWWRDKGGDPANDADLQGLIGGITPPPGGVQLDCDAELTAFLARLEQAVRS